MKRSYSSLLLVSLSAFVFLTNSTRAQTFYEDVAPIMYDHCTHCHRPGDIASTFPFTDYNECVSNGVAIQSYVNFHPVWPPDTAYHHYAHEDVLTPAEKNLIMDWVSNGMAAGNPNNAPPGPVYGNESFIADPDMVLSMAQPYTVPANATDHYQLFVIPTGFAQQNFVRALELRPQFASLIHHAEILVDTTGALADEDLITPGYGLDVNAVAGINHSRLLTIYHQGDRVQLFPQGMGYRIPANADLILKIHYLPQTSPIDDSAWVNVFFVDTLVVQEVHCIAVDEDDLLEPIFMLAKDQVQTLHHQLTICSDWSLLSISPQLNVLGKSMKVFSVSPSNDTVQLIHVPFWLHNDQYLYYFPSPELLDSSSNLFSKGVFDNTVNNPDNPNNPPLNWFHDSLAIDDDFKVYVQFTGSTDCLNPTGIENDVQSFQSFSIQPNPAEEESAISFSLPKTNAVTITIYDCSGRMRKTILQNEILSAGFHEYNMEVNDLPAGIYFCNLKTENMVVTKKLLIQR